MLTRESVFSFKKIKETVFRDISDAKRLAFITQVNQSEPSLDNLLSVIESRQSFELEAYLAEESKAADKKDLHEAIIFRTIINRSSVVNSEILDEIWSNLSSVLDETQIDKFKHDPICNNILTAAYRIFNFKKYDRSGKKYAALIGEINYLLGNNLTDEYQASLDQFNACHEKVEEERKRCDEMIRKTILCLQQVQLKMQANEETKASCCEQSARYLKGFFNSTIKHVNSFLFFKKSDQEPLLSKNDGDSSPTFNNGN